MPVVRFAQSGRRSHHCLERAAACRASTKPVWPSKGAIGAVACIVAAAAVSYATKEGADAVRSVAVVAVSAARTAAGPAAWAGVAIGIFAIGAAYGRITSSEAAGSAATATDAAAD